MRPCFPDQLLLTKLLLGVDMPHAPQQLATFLAFHQQAVDEFGATCSAGGRRSSGGDAGRAWWLWEWAGR